MFESGHPLLVLPAFQAFDENEPAQLFCLREGRVVAGWPERKPAWKGQNFV
jgi:hypothetical protein